jgi:hypothetical protein
MNRSMTYLTLAACLAAVPSAVAQQSGHGPQDQPRPPDAARGERTPVESPDPAPPVPAGSPYSAASLDSPYAPYLYASTPYGYRKCVADRYDGSAAEGRYGTGASAGGGDSASTSTSSGGGSARALEVILNASGVPYQNGQVAWPLGLRLLRADAELQQVEAQLQLAVEQVTAGEVNPRLLDEIRLNVEDLRQLLLADKEWRFSMPLAVYEDAERFLRKLKRAPQILAAAAPAGRSEVTAP